jgi:hypothetical protein
VHSLRQAIVALREVKQWKHETMEDYCNKFLQLCVVIPQQPDDVYLWETFREGLRKKLKLAIIGILRATIVEVTNSTKEIEEEMPTPHRSRQSQPLLNSDDSHEELVKEEQKKEKRKNCKEWDDEYQQGVFYQKCHNEGHLTKECKLLQTICNICQRQVHEANDCPLKELGEQYVKKDILVNVVQPKASFKQVKQDQSFRHLDNNNLSYDNQRWES